MTFRPIGVHVSISGGFTKALERAEELGCSAMQIFCGNPRGWKPLRVSGQDIKAFRARRKKGSVKIVVAHAIYLINPAAPDTAIRAKSAAKLENEIEIASELEADFYLIHMARPGLDPAGTLKRYCDTVSSAARKLGGATQLILENTAAIERPGKGFQWMGKAMAEIKTRIPVGVCLDTAHLFGAGFDLRTKPGINQTLDEFDQAVGLKRLRLIHTNDSKSALGSGQDRHEHIGKGTIGNRALKMFLCDDRIAHTPLVLETPHMTEAEDRRNLRAIRRLLGQTNRAEEA